MRRPMSNNDISSTMESATLNERAAVASDRNYMNAHRYLGTVQMRIRELTENETKNSEQLERLQQKAIDIKDVFALVERELEHVEDDDWLPRLRLPPQLIEPEAPGRTASAPAEDVRPKDPRRSPADDQRRDSASGTASRYRPTEDYRPSPPPAPVNRARSPGPVPEAPSPPPAVGIAPIPDGRARVAMGGQGPLPHRSSKEHRGPELAAPNVPLPPLPSNIEFNHGPLFSECVASLKLSDYVYDLVDAKEDLKDARDKLRKAEEADDPTGVQKYQKRAAKYDKEVKELEQDHWKKEVNPLRQAYSVEIMRCLQQLNAGIQYTEELPDNGKSEADALSDMMLLKEWLNRSLIQPKTWRKDDRLLVGLIEGHPQRKLKDASYVTDLLDEAVPAEAKKEKEGDRPKAATSSSRKRDEESDSDRRPTPASSSDAMKPIAINGDLLEGLLNGAVPKEVAANITQCQECNGTGGDLTHAKICSECEGKGSHPDAEDAIELCPKCNGRGFALSKKYRCPVCDAYKIVMNVPADTVDPRKSRDRDAPSNREPEDKSKGSDSTRRKASFAQDVPVEAPPQRSRSKKGRDRDYESESRDEPDDFSDGRKSKSRSKKHRDRDDRDRDRDRDISVDSRSPSPDDKPNRSHNRRQSTARPKEEQPDAGAGLTGLIGAIAGAANEPGSWTGKKGKKILEAALAAGAGGILGGSGGGGGDKSEDGRSDEEEDDRHGSRHRKRRGSRYER
jgi:hypothetical protein